MAEAPYARVYWTIRDDEKFATVYDDDRLLATWLRLLIEADGMFPAPAAVPRNAHPAALRRLVTAGLVDLVGANHYRIHGLASERDRRSAAAKAAALARWNARNPGVDAVHDAAHSDIPSGRNAGASSEPMLAELSRAKLSKDETSKAEQAVANVIAYIEERTRSPFVYGNGSKVWNALMPDIRNFGSEAVIVAMTAASHDVPYPDAAQLVFGAARALHPLSTGKTEKPAGGHTRSAQEVDDAFTR